MNNTIHKTYNYANNILFMLIKVEKPSYNSIGEKRMPEKSHFCRVHTIV